MSPLKEHSPIRYRKDIVYESRNTFVILGVGCPFNSKFQDELDIIQKYEPNLYKACNYVFGKSYDLTMKYREFKER